MKKLIALTFATLTLALPVAAFAQFSLPSLGGKSSSGGAQPDLSGQQDSLVRGFVAANKDVLTANSKMADALGLKEKSGQAQATADSLGEGATKDNLSDANKVVADSGNAVAAEMAKKPVLDAQAKTTFGLGLVALVSGVNKYVGLGKNVKDMSSGLSSASPMMLPKLQSAAYVVSNFPGSASNVAKVLKNAIDFAKSNGIEVPANANDALKSI